MNPGIVQLSILDDELALNVSTIIHTVPKVAGVRQDYLNL